MAMEACCNAVGKEVERRQVYVELDRLTDALGRIGCAITELANRTECVRRSAPEEDRKPEGLPNLCLLADSIRDRARLSHALADGLVHILDTLEI